MLIKVDYKVLYTNIIQFQLPSLSMSSLFLTLKISTFSFIFLSLGSKNFVTFFNIYKFNLLINNLYKFQFLKGTHLSVLQ